MRGTMTACKPRYARIGDIVTIETPMLFIRCGYSLTKDIVRNKYKDEVTKIMGECSEVIRKAMYIKGIQLVSLDSYTQRSLESTIVSAILRREGFGGRERKIHEVEVDGIKGEKVRVIGKGIVVTGQYRCASGGYCTYYGEYDYDPPGLDSEQRHVIYEVEFNRCLALTLPKELLLQTGPTKIRAIYCSTQTTENNPIKV